MQILFYIIWIMIGALLAVIYTKSQQWSVSIINPRLPRLSKWLIVGGAFIRWFIITIALIFALRSSITTMLFTFFTFIISRIFILLRWQWLINAKKKQVI